MSKTPPEPSLTLEHLQLHSTTAGCQRQAHLDGRSATAHHTHWRRSRKPLKGSQEWFQGLDGQAGLACRAGHHSPKVEAEPVKTQGRTLTLQLQLTLGAIQARDLGLHKAHTSCPAEVAQVDGALLKRSGSAEGRGDQTGVEAGGAVAHQGDGLRGRAAGGLHRPATQQQGMGVAASGEQQLTHR